MEMNRKNLREVRKRIEYYMKSIETDMNVKIELGNITYDRDSFRVKMSARNTADSSGNTVNPEEVTYEKYRAMYSLPKFGTAVSVNGKPARIIGFKPRSTKYPVLVEMVSTGKKFKLTIEHVRI